MFPQGLGCPPAFSCLIPPFSLPPIRMSPRCSSVPTSWIKKISLGSPTPSWCSTEATRMEREFPGNNSPSFWGPGWTGCGSLPAEWLETTFSLRCPGAPALGRTGDQEGSQGSEVLPWPMVGPGRVGQPKPAVPLRASAMVGARYVGGGGSGRKQG